MAYKRVLFKTIYTFMFIHLYKEPPDILALKTECQEAKQFSNNAH